MKIEKCPTCGGRVIYKDNQKIGVCEFCGNKFERELSILSKIESKREKEEVGANINGIELEIFKLEKKKEALDKCSAKKIWISIAISIASFAMSFLFVDNEVSDFFAVLLILGYVMSFVELKKGAAVFADKKGGTALGILLQLCTLCIFGIVSGFSNLKKIKTISKEKESINLKIRELNKRKDELKKDIKNY